MLCFAVFACLTASDNEAAVGDPAVVTVKLFLRDEVNGSVVIGKIVGHGLDLLLDLCLVCALLCDYEALSCVLLTGGKVGIFAASYSVDSLGNGDSVLLSVGNALNASDSVGMSLRNALAPEGVILAVGQEAVAEQSVKGEKSRVPAH